MDEKQPKDWETAFEDCKNGISFLKNRKHKFALISAVGFAIAFGGTFLTVESLAHQWPWWATALSFIPNAVGLEMGLLAGEKAHDINHNLSEFKREQEQLIAMDINAYDEEQCEK